MSTTFKEKIANDLEDQASILAKSRGLQLLRINVRGAEQSPVIEIVLDGPKLVSIEDCEMVSKELNKAIEENKMVKGNYRLDVLSPGVEEPLVEEWQFTRNVGRVVEIHYSEEGEHHTIHGRLNSVTAEDIVITPLHLNGKAKKDALPIDKIKDDEQLYENPVALVKVSRKLVDKVLVQPELARK